MQGEPRAQHFTDVRLDSLARIVDDDTRWQWSQGRSGGGGSSRVQQEEVEEEDPALNSDGKVT